MENEKLNQRILNIWKEHFDEIKAFSNNEILWPVLSPEFHKNSILFIGINPSGDTGNNRDKFLIKNKDNLYDKKKIEDLIKNEKENIWGNGYRVYFKPFQDISNELKTPFDHLDLYFFRMRSSKKYSELLMKHKDSEFFKKQLGLSFETIIQDITPKVIFVANKEASRIFKEEFKKNIKLDEQEGFHVLSINNKKIPVFLSGMISSARYIDKYSLERITWHIGKALEFYKVNNENNRNNN